jgi:hypothetical protein
VFALFLLSVDGEVGKLTNCASNSENRKLEPEVRNHPEESKVGTWVVTPSEHVVGY